VFADRRAGWRVGSLRDRHPIDPASAHPVAATIRSGQTGRYGHVADGVGGPATGAAPDPGARRPLGLAGAGSVVVTPLRGKAGVLGAIVLGSHQSRRHGEGDIEIIEQLARRTGIALERRMIAPARRR
jgi:GAF domain-containing protein